MAEEAQNTWGTDESKPPPALKPGPVKQTGVINWCRSQIIDMLARWQRERVVAGRNITIDQTAGGRVIHAQPPQYAVPFHVVPDAQNGATGVRVGAGYLIIASQALGLTVTGLRSFYAVNTATAGYAYIEVSFVDGYPDSAQVVANAGGWSGFPEVAAFTTPPLSWTGSGTPPVQTKLFITLARLTGNTTDPLRQLWTSHIQLRLSAYRGVAAFLPFAGMGPNQP